MTTEQITIESGKQRIYTAPEVLKMYKSFAKYLEDRGLPSCDMIKEIHYPDGIEVILTANTTLQNK